MSGVGLDLIRQGFQYDHPAIRNITASFLAAQTEAWIKSEQGEVEDKGGKKRSVLEWKEMWEQSPLYAVVQKSPQYKELTQRGVAGAVGVLNRTALEAAFPATNFRDYATVLPTDEVPVKFTVRSRPTAYEVTSSGSFVLVTGPQQTQTSVDGKTFKAEAQWDLEFAEDMPFPELAVSTAEIGEALSVQEASNGLNILHAAVSATLTTTAADAGGDLLKMRRSIRKNQRRPNFLQTDEDWAIGLYNDAKLRDKTLWGEVEDVRRGVLGTFFGVDFFQSTLNETAPVTNPDQPIMGDSRFLVHIVRRDMTLTPYTEKGSAGLYGTIRANTGVLEAGAFIRGITNVWTG